MKLNPVLRSFWYADGDPKNGKIKARNRVLYGGRSSSKSWEFAGMIAHEARRKKSRVLCVRRFQNKISESVYSLIKKQIESMDKPARKNYTIQKTKIYHKNGSDFSFYGIERNVDEIKSFEGADYLWIEEAHNLTKDQWDILEPTIRKEGSEIWLSFNPRLITDFVYERFIINTPPDTILRLINYDDNKFISKTMLSVIEAKKKEDIDEYNHIYRGVPLHDDDQAVIKRTWVEAAIDAHINLSIDMTGKRIIGYDVADSGEDRNCAAVFNGCILEKLDAWKAKEDELRKSALRARGHAGEQGFLIYDSIGVGAHTGSTLKDSGFFNHAKFNAGESVFEPNKKDRGSGIRNKDKFENLKAQAWFNLADRFRNTYNAINKGEKFKPDEMISISSKVKDLEKLKTELCAPHKNYSNRGLDQVESKKDVKKRLEKSHDLADAFVMGASIRFVRKPSTAVRTY